MNLRWLGVLVVVVTPLTVGARQDAVARDLKKLEGTWKVTKVEVDPKEKSPSQEELEKLRFVFKGDKFAIEVDGKKMKEATFTLDPSKKPATLDIQSSLGKDKGIEAYGLYQFEGDIMKLCIKDAGSTRPTEFKAGSRTRVIRLKRAGP